MTNVTGNQFGDTEVRSVLCDTDLSAKQNYFVNFDASDDDVVNLASAGTAIPYILLEGKDGSTGGAKAGLIAYGGRAKVILGATVAPNTPVMSDGSGKAITATDGKYFGAITVHGGVSGDIVEVIVTQGVYKTVS